MNKIYDTLLAATQGNPVVPVITVHDLSQTIAIGQKLKSAGFTTLEVTLRTPVALEAIKILKSEFPEMITGAGTITQPEHIDDAIEAGSDFLVTPATPFKLADVLRSCPVPVLPGCATATEAQTLYEMGYEILKFFPAEANGGAPALKSFSAPLPHLKFMPTGGIKEHTAADYLALPNVLAIGGSWMMK